MRPVRVPSYVGRNTVAGRATMSHLFERIEREISRAGLDVIVEEDGARLVLTGMVSTERERDAAVDIARALAAGHDVDDGIEVAGALPAQIGSGSVDETEAAGFAGATAGLESDDALSAVDLQDRGTLVDPTAASGPSGTHDDDVSEGGAVYVPSSDPVGTNREVIGGFQSDAMERVEVRRSALDGVTGDEALADAVRRELREDAATTDLDVFVEVQERVALLRGRVPMLQDAENAEAVAARVPGVAEVLEELSVADMDDIGGQGSWR